MGSDRLYKELIGKFKMTEGRRSQVVLLDERRLEILVQPKLYAGELLDMVASHFSLKEKDYFGLAYQDETGHHNWLQLDRRVLEHDFPKKNNQGQLTLYFLVKYFVESLSHLRDSATVEAFYLQAKSLVFKGTIEIDSETSFELAALVLQATHGDYVDEESAKNHLKKLPVLPTSTYKEHPSISVCEEKVVDYYKALAGQSRGSAIIKYLSIVEAQPTYGIHYYQVKDKGAIPWWLGLSQKGISQYDQTDKKIPRRVFLWKQLENLYFRDRKFSIEVHDHKRVSVSRRTFGPGNVTVYVWFASTPNLTKCIWSMAISQHKFYLNKKHSSKSQSNVLRNLGQIAAELTRSAHSLSSSGSTPNLSRSASSHSLPALKIEGEISDETKAAHMAMLSALKAKKEALEEVLLRKTAELKALCIQEGEITGELPPDTPLAPGENPPQVRRRVGTSFTLSDRLISSIKTKEEEALAKLELDFEIQTKISSAAFKLANDVTAKKNVRRQRTITYQQAHVKLKEIEKKLVAARKQAEAKKRQMRQASDDEPSEDSISHSTDDSVSHDKVLTVNDSNPALHMQLEDANNQINRVLLTCSQRQSKSPSPAFSNSSSSLRQSGACPSPVSISAPPSPSKHRHSVHSHSLSTPPPSPVFRIHGSGRALDGQGYKPSTVYQTKISYRSRHYPTLPLNSSRYSNSSDYDNISTGSSGGLSIQSPYQNRFEANLNTEGSNLYSVPTQRTSQAFDSQDDTALPAPAPKTDCGLMSRHNSLDSMRRHTYQKQHYHHHGIHSQMHSPVVQLPPRSPLPSSLSYDDRLRLIPSPHKHQECRDEEVGASPAQHVHLQHQPSFLHHHHMHHMAYHHYQFHEKPDQTSANRNYHSVPRGDCVDGPMRPKRTDDVELEQLINCNEQYELSTVQRRPTVLPLSQRNTGLEQQQRPQSSITMLKPISIVHPHQWSHQSSASSPLLSPKPKNRDWVETSLDSPIPARRSRSQLASPMEAGRSVSPRARTPTQTTEDVQSLKEVVVMTERTTPIKSPVPSINYQNGVEVNVVSVGHFQPYWEETKPYELSDFYKYSTKHRQANKDSPNKVQVPMPMESLNPLPISPRGSKLSPQERWEAEKGSPVARAASREGLVNGAISPIGTALVKSPGVTSPDGSLSFDENRCSVADAFHEEMLAWYEDQENVKKATLV